MVGVRHAEDRAGLARGEGLQADPVGQVRVQATQLALLEPLRGEQQVDVQRPAETADRDEELREIRFLREQFGELVDDDDERGHRLERRARAAGLLVLADVGEVPGPP